MVRWLFTNDRTAHTINAVSNWPTALGIDSRHIKQALKLPLLLHVNCMTEHASGKAQG
jgi:hypothetical protein